ncbi:DUF5681 domain-containing protein [Oricola sp.]|uniref:DUF5681 domain-containing protein n=1 Tax=Oricola sp. TaxID=1979950 RepID=UPI0025D8D26A|nr:DUF5681 domain-containing protein [Oricola sp.]MCI5074002.1 DUF5681 domain-containing protein [Oricola sp.]
MSGDDANRGIEDDDGVADTDAGGGGEGPVYEVGYKKPPVQTRFQKGNSGNRKGRPKGRRDFRTDLERTLMTRRKVKRGDKVVALSTQEIMLENLAGKAAGGDTKSVGLMLQAIGKYLADEVGVQENGELDLEEADILNIALERFVQRHTAPDEREEPSEPNTVTAPPSAEPAPPAEPVIQRDEPVVKQPQQPSVLDKLRNRK